MIIARSSDASIRQVEDHSVKKDLRFRFAQVNLRYRRATSRRFQEGQRTRALAFSLDINLLFRFPIDGILRNGDQGSLAMAVLGLLAPGKRRHRITLSHKGPQ